jgi:hypothetical protein
VGVVRRRSSRLWPVRCDLVTVLLGSHLAQDRVRRRGPGTHHVKRASVKRALKAVACGLAIAGHLLVGQWFPSPLLYLREPTQKTGAKGCGRYPRQHPRKRIVGGHPMRPRKKALQPLRLGPAICFNSHPGIRTAKNGTHGDHHDIPPEVPLGPIHPWLGSRSRRGNTGCVAAAASVPWAGSNSSGCCRPMSCSHP